jgi:hypothetical protein
MVKKTVPTVAMIILPQAARLGFTVVFAIGPR